MTELEQIENAIDNMNNLDFQRKKLRTIQTNCRDMIKRIDAIKKVEAEISAAKRRERVEAGKPLFELRSAIKGAWINSKDYLTFYSELREHRNNFSITSQEYDKARLKHGLLDQLNYLAKFINQKLIK